MKTISEMAEEAFSQTIEKTKANYSSHGVINWND